VQRLRGVSIARTPVLDDLALAQGKRKVERRPTEPNFQPSAKDFAQAREEIRIGTPEQLGGGRRAHAPDQW